MPDGTVMVEACLQVTLFLEDGSLLPRMGKESFTYVICAGTCLCAPLLSLALLKAGLQ